MGTHGQERVRKHSLAVDDTWDRPTGPARDGACVRSHEAVQEALARQAAEKRAELADQAEVSERRVRHPAVDGAGRCRSTLHKRAACAALHPPPVPSDRRATLVALAALHIWQSHIVPQSDQSASQHSRRGFVRRITASR